MLTALFIKSERKLRLNRPGKTRTRIDKAGLSNEYKHRGKFKTAKQYAGSFKFYALLFLTPVAVREFVCYNLFPR